MYFKYNHLAVPSVRSSNLITSSEAEHLVEAFLTPAPCHWNSMDLSLLTTTHPLIALSLPPNPAGVAC